MASSEFTGITINYFWRIMTTLPYTSGLPEDVVVNNWVFVGEGPTDHTLAAGWLGALYDAIGPSLSGKLSRTAGVVTHQVYDLSRARPNPPIATYTDTLPAKSTNYVDEPLEVALVGSFQAAPLAGQVQARRRGRVYFGPFCTDPSSTDNSGPGSALCTLIANAMGAMHTSSEASSLCRWAQWSPTNAGGWMIPGQSGPPNLDAGVSPIANGWVDNDWDTQRRRGPEATARYTFS